jgi:hypothetical protein
VSNDNDDIAEHDDDEERRESHEESTIDELRPSDREEFLSREINTVQPNEDPHYSMTSTKDSDHSIVTNGEYRQTTTFEHD